uniref:Uncharacterized protein n=2 Tax=Lygus hesperus TaxID=30085 RepID=A0A0K8TH30_LYGHE
MESNRKLQSGATSVDSSLLQSQIDTLQWQLKQAESNRQMYRAVMEQVSKFLERVHKALEGGSPSKYPQRGKSRPATDEDNEVPRSRSVHTVVTQSRASSPSPSHTINVHRANSISQMQDSSYSTYSRDCTWRGSRASAEEVAPERLSQDAFRLLRTVQSLLGTREPDLARVADTSQRRDSTSMGSCSSLVQSSCCGAREGEDNKSGGGPSTPQLSVGSTEDESGFSSMSSFHDTNGDTRAPTVNGTANGTSTTNGTANGEGSHHELGLPLVEPHRHRRWSSTPVDTGFRQPLRVLWQGDRSSTATKLCLQKDRYTVKQNCVF